MLLEQTNVDLHDVRVTILAGGSGTRLWPLSRAKSPKQLLSLTGERSMLQQTIDRVLPLVPAEHIYILTGPEHAPLIAEQVRAVPSENILIEPTPRGTAPCLGLAAMRLRRNVSAEGVMISLHADHAIAREERFRDALVGAVLSARRGHIVTIGIIPAYPETGYGYIERGAALGSMYGQETFHVARFTEKPPLEQAREFVASGRFYWNAGYFIWPLGYILEEFQRLLPEMYTQLEAIVEAADSPEAEAVFQRVWNQIKPTTIDVGIMERAHNVAVIPCDLGWSDIGSWASLFDILPHDSQHNVLMGHVQHVGIDTRNSLIYSPKRLVATIGLDDIVIIDTGEALLVLPKGRAQDVGALVKELRARGLDKYL
jgi:mannose-1-phosphate guanylyltransferase